MQQLLVACELAKSEIGNDLQKRGAKRDLDKCLKPSVVGPQRLFDEPQPFDPALRPGQSVVLQFLEDLDELVCAPLLEPKKPSLGGLVVTL